jgi:peptidyl-prolyl isomerase G (cyclophilin G)
MTSENFRGLCTGEYGSVGLGGNNKSLHYLNAPIHRVIENFVV